MIDLTRTARLLGATVTNRCGMHYKVTGFSHKVEIHQMELHFQDGRWNFRHDGTAINAPIAMDIVNICPFELTSEQKIREASEILRETANTGIGEGSYIMADKLRHAIKRALGVLHGG